MSTVAAIVLAAGQGRRYQAGESTKLLAVLHGTTLIERVVRLACASRAAPVVVVTGHCAVAVGAALDGLPVRITHNPGYQDGMAGSLAEGLRTLPPEASGALILLADMPLVRPETLDRLITAFETEAPQPEAVIPMFDGTGGNPVLLGRSIFSEASALRGDQGARKLLGQHGRWVATCKVDDPGIVIDIDTRDALNALAARR